MSETRILMFDSGVGGLSVFQEIQARLPTLSCTYIFDNEAYPYGELPQTELIDRVERYVAQFVQKQDIALVVVACNTASTVVLPRLRALLSIPVVGVVPAIKPASQHAMKGVGLIATPATVTRQYTRELIKDFSQNKEVYLLGTTQLVEMAEQKLRGHKVDLMELRQILSPLMNCIDVAVLGCTHFPLLKQEIQQVLGKNVLLVDSGEAIARRVKGVLGERRNRKYTSEEKYQIYSSAEPKDKVALQRAVSRLGFSEVKIQPLVDA